MKESLAVLVEALDEARISEWWILGGAATALFTADYADVHDIDVLLSPTNARRMIQRYPIAARTDGGTERFRSEVYGTWYLPVPIDFLGGFQIRSNGLWTTIWPHTRQPLETSAGTVFLPAIEEHIEITRLLGRPRDFERIARLRQKI